jgi:hypothetical protein
MTGPVAPIAPGKTRITLAFDVEILEWFRAQVHKAGGGDYQDLINAALREYIKWSEEPLEQMLRRVIREEIGLHACGLLVSNDRAISGVKIRIAVNHFGSLTRKVIDLPGIIPTGAAKRPIGKM